MDLQILEYNYIILAINQFENYSRIINMIQTEYIDNFSKSFETAIELFDFNCKSNIKIFMMKYNQYYGNNIVMNIHTLFNKLQSNSDDKDVIKNLNAWSSILNYICLLLYIKRDNISLKYLLELIEYSSVFNAISKILNKEDQNISFYIKRNYIGKILEPSDKGNIIYKIINLANRINVNLYDLFILHRDINDENKQILINKTIKKICNIIIFNLDERDIYRIFIIDKKNKGSFIFMIDYINNFYIPILKDAINYIIKKQQDNISEYLYSNKEIILGVLSKILFILSTTNNLIELKFLNLDNYIIIILYIYKILLNEKQYLFLIATIVLYKLLKYINNLDTIAENKQFIIIDVNKVFTIYGEYIDEKTFNELTKNDNITDSLKLLTIDKLQILLNPEVGSSNNIIYIQTDEAYNALIKNNTSFMFILFKRSWSTQYSRLLSLYIDLATTNNTYKFAIIMYEDIKDIPQLNNLFLTLNEPNLIIFDVDVDTNAKGTRKETKIIGKTIETYLQDKKKHVSTITALQSEEPPVELPANKYDITNVNEITSLDELDILKQDYNIVIALLSSDAGCSGCDIIKPIYKDLANNNTNNNIIFVKINADLIENEAEINEIKEYFIEEEFYEYIKYLN